MKNNLKWVLLTLVAVILYSCSAEQDALETEEKERPNRRYVNLSELPFLQAEIEARKANVSSRSVQDYLDLIISENVLEYTNLDSTKTYTFALDLEVNDTLSNVIITQKSNHFESYLVQYVSEDLELWLTQIQDSWQTSVDVEILVHHLMDFESRGEFPCMQTGRVCPSGEHEQGQEDACVYKDLTQWSFTVFLAMCDDGASGGGGGGGSPGAGTSPTLPPPPPPDPESALKKMTNNNKNGTKTLIKQKIDELRTKCINPSQITEDGAQYIKSGNTYIERPPDFTGPNEIRFDNPDFAPGTEVVLHMHQLHSYVTSGNTVPLLQTIVPLFSDGDIAAFAGLGDFTGFTNNNITAMLVSQAGTFALRMSDPSKLQQASQLLQPVGADSDNNPIPSADMKKLETDYFEEIVKPCADTDTNCFKTNFIKFIKTFTLSNGQTLGISVHEAIYDSNGNIINWVQL